MNARRAVAAACLVLGAAVPLAGAAGKAAQGASSDASVGVGQSIYLRGVLGSGAALRAIRAAGDLSTKGADAACVNCHQRSGLGATEGRNLIPPITGRYLFNVPAKGTEAPDLPYVEGMRVNRTPYTEATLARAIRDGVDSNGRTLSYLMPRFPIEDADMAALIGYLKSMGPHRVPGVTDSVLHFATVITPDADPVKRAGMLDVMQKYFDERNSRQRQPTAPMQPSGRTMYSKMMFKVNRRWQLHVWDLTGPASTWRAQLARRMADEPVLAIVSGLGASDWAPVHQFCEDEAVPCLFPNVEVPVDAGPGFYSLYFSKGVLLEADLIAGRIADGGAPAPKSVHQVYRAGDSGAAAASELASTLKAHGIAAHSHVIAAGADSSAVLAALAQAGDPDALVLWLRPADIAQLGAAPPAHAAVFMSGLMAGLERAPLIDAWRSRTDLAYPFDLPDRRRIRVDYPLGWFHIRQIPVVAEQVQADTYLACGLLSETENRIVDAFIRPYLIERLQAMIEHRVITGYYPHLTLATNQHFASKGGYLVRFAAATGTRVIPDGDWSVP